jgi:DNA ligase-1
MNIATKDTNNTINPSAEKGGLELFAELITELNSSTKTNDKLDALSDYFVTADGKDRVWVIAIFSGRRPRRAVNSTLLRTWCAAIINIEQWLFEESYNTVGDLAETIALLLPETKNEIEQGQSLSHYLEKFILLEKQDEKIRKQFILDSWQKMNRNERFVFNKLITGNFRIGVSQKMMVNALAKIVKLSSSEIAHRISGNWDPVTTTFSELLSKEGITADDSKPYPFYLSYALEEDPATLGSPEEWQAEWKWDGIRGQLIKRNNELFVWSRGEDLMTDKFPEYHILKDVLPNGIVLDGEIIPLKRSIASPSYAGDDLSKSEFLEGLTVLPFSVLQTRIGRKNITRKQLEEAPIGFFCLRSFRIQW